MKRKLNSKSGATLLIILVGMLLAIMVSVVIVTASVTSAQRVLNDRKTNQAHLTLESAAQVIREGMEETTYSFSTDDDGAIIASTVSVTGTFAKEMQTAVETVYSDSKGNYSSSDTDGTNFTVTLSSDADVSAIETVNVTFVMKNNSAAADDKYDVTFTLSIEGSSREMFMTISGTCEEIDYHSYKITWNGVSINELGA